jgi:hypothetical protein
VLDLGAGNGEFTTNAPVVFTPHSIDANEDGKNIVGRITQDCSKPGPDWLLVNVIFTSNFFEHLPTRAALAETIQHAYDHLTNDGIIICMGPNINAVGNAYWNFIDHHIALTDQSLCESLRVAGFKIEKCVPRFLPYTMVNQPKWPIWTLKMYLKCPWLWPFFGGQFLIIARKP